MWRGASQVRPRGYALPDIACADATTSSADVSAWESGDGRAWHVTLTAVPDALAASVALPGAAAAWPESGLPAGGSTTPATSRPAIEGAPGEIARRTALPGCGTSDRKSNTAAYRCLIDAVLAGLPAELIVNTSGTEGDRITILYRYMGTGAVIEYQGGEGSWYRSPGALIVDPGGRTFSFEQWSQGESTSATPSPRPSRWTALASSGRPRLAGG